MIAVSRKYIDKMMGNDKLPQRATIGFIILSSLGATLAITLSVFLSAIYDCALMMAPFGASCFLAFSLPDSPLAQPRNIVIGHVLSAGAGFISLYLFGDYWFGGAFGVGLAVFLMLITRTSHAPAGANPLVVYAAQPDLMFLLTPVFFGACLIAGFAIIYNNFRPNICYPKYW